MKNRPSPSPRLAGVVARERPRPGQIAAIAPPARAGQNSCPYLRRRERQKRRLSSAARFRGLAVVHCRVADSPGGGSPPAGGNPQRPLSRSERFPTRATKLPAESLHLDGPCPVCNRAFG